MINYDQIRIPIVYILNTYVTLALPTYCNPPALTSQERARAMRSLPFSPKDLWELHQYYFSPPGGTASHSAPGQRRPHRCVTPT